MIRPTPLMLDRLGKVLRIGDKVLVLGVFPAVVKDFVQLSGELGAVVQRSAGSIGFAYFEEIERSKNNETYRCTGHPNQEIGVM